MAAQTHACEDVRLRDVEDLSRGRSNLGGGVWTTRGGAANQGRKPRVTALSRRHGWMSPGLVGRRNYSSMRAQQPAQPEQTPLRQADRSCCGKSRNVTRARRATSCVCGASGTSARHHGRTCIRCRRCLPTSLNTVPSGLRSAERLGTRANRRRPTQADVVSKTSG